MTTEITTAALAIRDLSKRYGTQPVLADLDLIVQPGETLALVGGNGVGKSTLIKLILDFIEPDQGEIHIFGQPNALPRSRLPLAYLPERFAPPGWMSARTYLRSFLDLYHAPWSEARIRALCETLYFDPNQLNKRIARLSKGMTQKVGLMAVFLSQKPLLILDEPMSGLDPLARIGVKQALRQLKAQGATILYSSHMLPDVEAISDRLAILHDRRFRFVGSVAECLAQTEAEHLEDAYLRLIAGDAPPDEPDVRHDRHASDKVAA